MPEVDKDVFMLQNLNAKLNKRNEKEKISDYRITCNNKNTICIYLFCLFQTQSKSQVTVKSEQSAAVS